eukprot:TRINITY_DN31112_c0_g1_i1.p1 TRINITY_DN31112_c0_g1~~TRINITY_DN31112_c0_g1_i1.p1  ORF type:complete len:623 (+),score=99.75 TRINITY_DN31112_c0_g1_i1:79-1947(+)
MTSGEVSPASVRIRGGSNGDGSSTPKEKPALQRANHLATGEPAGADSMIEPSRRVRRPKREAIALGEEDLPNARRTRSTEGEGKSGFGSSSSSTAEVVDFPAIDSAGPGSSTVVAVAAASGSASGGGQAAEEPETPSAKSKSRIAATSVSQAGAQPLTPVLRHLALALRLGAQADRRGDREQLCRLAHRLGRFKRCLLGRASVRDASVQWEGGQESDELEARRSRLAEQKSQVDELKNSLQKPKRRQQTSASATEGPSPEELDEEAAEAWECKELISAKLCAINREEIELKEKELRLNSDRMEYFRKFCMIDDEDKDVVGNSRLLMQRYQILRLLGKGRNKSIYRAYDLSNQRLVALQLYRKAPDSKVSAAADCERAKSLKHPSIATLLDSFIDADTGSYILVWEFAEGEPLDSYIRKAGSSEKEARGIILQLLSALRYLESKRHGLDGQDLRSSRLVIRGGGVKIGTLTLPSFKKKSTPSTTAPLLLQGSPDQGAPGLNRHASEDPRLAADSLPSADETQDTMGDTDGLLGDSLGISAAIHTVGSVLHELLFGKKAENPETSASAFQPEPAVVQLPDMPKLTTECRDFLVRLLDHDRCLTATEAYADPFLMPMVKKYRGGG